MFFFFNDTATTEIYTLSLHDALPICRGLSHDASPPGHRRATAVRRGARGARAADPGGRRAAQPHRGGGARAVRRDRKSTRLNSSHANISYAVFCLKKKKIIKFQKYII